MRGHSEGLIETQKFTSPTFPDSVTLCTDEREVPIWLAIGKGCYSMKQKTVTVNKGLYALFYDTAEDVFAPPAALVSVEPGSSGRLALILEPDASDAVLLEPGSCLVIRATDVGQFRIEMVPARQNGSTAATIKLQMLTKQPGATKEAHIPASEPNQSPRTLDINDLRVVGHVAGIGDVTVKAEEWIAGPSAPSQIEGFAIEWPGKPDDVEIRYAAKIGGETPVMTNLVSSGAYAGARGRTLPLVGLTIELSGPGARRYQLAVEALFLGSPKVRVTGEHVVVRGPTGNEPLVGIRLGLQKASMPEDASHADSEKERAQDVKASGRRNSRRRSTTKKAGSK